MGSPLGPVLAGIFMVELKTRIIPTLGNMDLLTALLLVFSYAGM